MKPLGASLWHCQPSLSFWPEQFLAVVSLVYSYYKLHQVPFLPHPVARNNPWVCDTVYMTSLLHASMATVLLNICRLYSDIFQDFVKVFYPRTL